MPVKYIVDFVPVQFSVCSVIVPVSPYLSTTLIRQLNKNVDKSLPNIAKFGFNMGEAGLTELPRRFASRRLTVWLEFVGAEKWGARRLRGQGMQKKFAMRANKIVGLRLI
jgi:hypothetical protein